MTGPTFKAIREKAELTQRRIAELFGKTIDTIQRWEHAKEVPLMAEAALRWHTRTLTKEDRVELQSKRDMEHVARVHSTIDPSDAQWLHTALSSPDDLHPDYLEALKKKYPHLFSETT